MIYNAFMALEAIQRDPKAVLPGLESWIGAFATVQWVVKTDAGACLTAAGRQAYDDMVRDRRDRRPKTA